MELDFAEDLKIDRFTLDSEWEKQPSIYHNWSVMLADAELERDRAKENVDLVRAELDLEVRSDPDSFNLTKVTESSVQSAIISDERYKKSVDNYLKLKYNHRIIQSAIEALNHKKYALDNLVKLFLSEYYLNDSPPKSRQEILNESMSKRTKRDVSVE